MWELNGEYVSSSLRRDVVQGSNGEYYLAKSSHTASNSNQRPVDGGSYSTYWDTFGATFSSVATDILFSQDVYANRTVNVGSSGSGYPLIRSDRYHQTQEQIKTHILHLVELHNMQL